MHYQAIKWLTENKIGVLRGNQMVTRQCYVIDTQGLNHATP